MEEQFNPALYEILYTTDEIAYICGSQGSFYRKAPLLTTAFTASNTLICNGSTVQFTDQSVGSPTGWNWTFEGGTPATSTLQNPVVTYATPGTYDVSLTITKNTLTNTLSKTDYIQVDGNVTTAPAQPSGPTSICGSFSYNYSVTPVPDATQYNWTATPASAGTFSGTGPTTAFIASNTWTGAFTINVSGASACGAGTASPALNVTSSLQPNVYSLFSGGGYCTGQAGYEIKLEDSDLGVNYQLYKDGVASGSLVPGTGNLLSFGLQPVGSYTVMGINGTCTANMQGVSMVYLIDPPATASQPTGPASTCNNVPSTFTATLPANGYTLVWTVTPSTAGSITQPTLTSAMVTWDPAFSGYASITVQGENECGTGAASPALSIMVNALPAPMATGITSVCKTQEITYSTASNTGSTYVWAVTGGTISSGQGSNQITVIWGYPGTGSVSVTETSAEVCTGGSPVLTVTISECTGINDLQAESLTIYPNPASDQLNVSFNSSLNASIRISIYNHLGQAVYHSDDINGNGKTPVKIDISQLKAGTYTIRVTGENESWNKIFIKNR